MFIAIGDAGKLARWRQLSGGARIMSPPQTMPLDTYKKTIAAAIADVLRPAGFRKSGLKFHRPVNDVVHLVALQSSASSTADTLRATINLGVWVPTLARADATPNVSEAQWQERLGVLMPSPGDRWWEVHSNGEVATAGRDIRDALLSYALPAFEALATAESLAALWRSGRSPGLTEFQAQRYLRAFEASSR